MRIRHVCHVVDMDRVNNGILLTFLLIAGVEVSSLSIAFEKNTEPVGRENPHETFLCGQHEECMGHSMSRLCPVTEQASVSVHVLVAATGEIEDDEVVFLQLRPALNKTGDGVR